MIGENPERSRLAHDSLYCVSPRLRAFSCKARDFQLSRSSGRSRVARKSRLFFFFRPRGLGRRSADVHDADVHADRPATVPYLGTTGPPGLPTRWSCFHVVSSVQLLAVRHSSWSLGANTLGGVSHVLGRGSISEWWRGSVKGEQKR